MTPFPSSDVSTLEQWMDIVDRTFDAQPRAARPIRARVPGPGDIAHGSPLDRLQHPLQTAAWAEFV